MARVFTDQSYSIEASDSPDIDRDDSDGDRVFWERMI